MQPDHDQRPALPDCLGAAITDMRLTSAIASVCQPVNGNPDRRRERMPIRPQPIEVQVSLPPPLSLPVLCQVEHLPGTDQVEAERRPTARCHPEFDEQ